MGHFTLLSLREREWKRRGEIYRNKKKPWRGRQAIDLHNLKVTWGLNPPFLDLLFSLFKLINQRHGLRKKYHQNSFISKTIETDPLRNLTGKHKIFCKTVKQQQQKFYHFCDEIEEV